MAIRERNHFLLNVIPISAFILFLITHMSACTQHWEFQGAKSNGISQTNDFMGEATNGPELVVQLSHSGNIRSMALSGDGRFLITASLNEKTVWFWDATEGMQLRKLSGHTELINVVAISKYGDYTLTGSKDGTARLWRTIDGKETQIFGGNWGHFGQVTAIAISPNGDAFLTGGEDKTVRLWRKGNDKPYGGPWKFETMVYSLAFLPNGQQAVIGSGRGAQILDFGENKIIRTIGEEKLTKVVHSVAVHQNGEYVLTGCQKDKIARLWDIKTGEHRKAFCGHEQGITAVAFSSDGHKILTASEDGTARLWDTNTATQIKIFEKPPGKVSSATISPDGKLIFIAKKNIVYGWEVNAISERPRLEFKGNSALVGSAAFSPRDGRFIVIGGQDNTACLWDSISGAQIRNLKNHEDQVKAVTFSPDGRFIITASRDGTARIWETTTGKEKADHFIKHCKGINTVSFSPDGGFVLTGDDDGTVKIWQWDAEAGKLTEPVPMVKYKFRIPSAAFSPPNGKKVIIASGHSVDLCERNGEKWGCRKIGEHTGFVNSATFHPKEPLALSAGADKKARIWDLESEKEIDPPLDHPEGVWAATFSPCGNFILTGGEDGIVRLWDAKKRIEVRSFRGHTTWVLDVTFSPPHGRFILTASGDQTARLWEAASGRELATLISFTNGTWAVVTRDGRFDANNLEEIKGLHWVMPDDPMRALPVEIFMRDYYEPQLLPKVLSGKEFKSIRSLAELNRVQPGVKILRVEKGSTPDIAKVTVEVSAAKGTFQRNGKEVPMETGVHDLRLYRNGQLVGQWPEAVELTYKSLNTTSAEELNAWRKATEIKLDKDGKATKTFTVRLPRREDLKEVDFTAYAFNLDRVKSETARQRYVVPAKLNTVKGRAYVITVGVSRTEDFLWKLRFASNDAELMQETMGKKLKDSKGYEKVVPVCLITTPPGTVDPEAQAVCGELIRPTKENIKTVLDILAGRQVDSVRFELLPQKLRAELRRVQPEDLVLLSFSSHGVTDDKSGEFYVLPYDLGMESAGKVTPELLRRSISSQELSLWLGSVDAEQLVMVVDACHSAAAVEVEGYKPGPMGNPGLGQLSYDKGMPILVASEALESAWAEGGYSLLTLALAREGIGEKQLGLNEALKYAEQRVPKLYEERLGKEEKKKIQEPKLFEFKR